MPDSGAIDGALMARLGSDTALLALVPNGVHWSVAPQGSTAFVVVDLPDSNAARMFGARAFESGLYIVQAVVHSSVPNAAATATAAAARLEALLDPQPPDPPATLTAAGYTTMTVTRDDDWARIHLDDVDDANPASRWHHRGALYRVVMST